MSCLSHSPLFSLDHPKLILVAKVPTTLTCYHQLHLRQESQWTLYAVMLAADFTYH